jgi:hypothetical protein
VWLELSRAVTAARVRWGEEGIEAPRAGVASEVASCMTESLDDSTS